MTRSRDHIITSRLKDKQKILGHIKIKAELRDKKMRKFHDIFNGFKSIYKLTLIL